MRRDGLWGGTIGLVALSLAACLAMFCGTAITPEATAVATTSSKSVAPLQPSFRLGPYLQFGTTRAGWLTDYSQYTYTSTVPRILSTTDEGVHWKPSLSGLRPRKRSDSGYVVSMDFVNGSYGWALLQNEGLIATSNGGRRWTRPAEPPQGSIASYSFADPQDGWALTDRGVLLRTVDGGRRWSTVVAPAPGVTLCADSPEEVWLGVPGGDVYVGTVGGPWRLKLAGSTVPDIHNSVGPNPTPPPPWLACNGPSVWALYDYGEAAGSTPYALERTLDEGSTWAEVLGAQVVPIPPPMLARTGGTLVDLGVPGPLDAWFLTYCGPCSFGSPTLTITTDGSSFRSVDLPLPLDTYGRPVDAAFAGPLNGWVVLIEQSVTSFGIPKKPPRYRTVVLATTDGGSSWRTADADLTG